MHSSARYTHGKRENRWFHRRRKSNENLNDKIACFSFPRVRIGLKWSPAPSKKLPKMDQKTAKFYSKTVSGPQLGRPDELGGDRMRVLKLRSSYKTSEQQRSTIGNHRTCIWNFCAPRRRPVRASNCATSFLRGAAGMIGGWLCNKLRTPLPVWLSK